MVVQHEIVRRITENRRLIDDLIKPEIFPAVAAPVPAPVALNDMLIADATPVWAILTGPAAQGEILVAGAAPFTQAWGAVDLLSLTHGDTTPQAVSRGSLIYGDAAPTWNELVLGPATNFLRSDGVDAAWSPILVGDLPAHNLLSATHGDTVIQGVTRGSIVYGDATPDWNELVIGAATNFLRSDGVDISWSPVLVTDLPAHNLLSAQHGDTVVQAVTRGSLVYGDATPDWNELVIGAASAHLESDGADVTWQANITMADDTWIGGAGIARITFDYTPAGDNIRFDNCGHVGIDNLLEHNGDLDTYLIFSPDFAGFRVGNVDMLQMQELAVGQDNVTVNPTGADVDFIVEAVGVANALIVQASDGFIGAGIAIPTGHLHVYDAAINATATYYGIRNEHAKTLGATDHNDNLVGIWNDLGYNQAAGEIGDAQVFYNRYIQTAGNVGDAINTRDVEGVISQLLLNGGTVFGDVYGIRSFIDIAAAFTIAGDVYGHYIWIDDDAGAAGTVYGLYLDEQTGVDYGIYQNGTADNYLGGNVGIGRTLPGARLELAAAGAGNTYIDVTDVNDAFNLRTRIGHVDGFGGILQAFDDANVGAVLFRSYGDSYLLGGNFGIADANPTEGRLSIVNSTADNGAIAYLYRDQGTVNQSGFYMHLDNAADDEAAMTIRHDGTGDLLQLFDGAVQVVDIDNTGHLTLDSTTGTIGPTLEVMRNLAAGSTNTAIARFQNLNAGDDQPVIRIIQNAPAIGLQVEMTTTAEAGFFTRDVNAAVQPVVTVVQDHLTAATPVLQLQQDDVSEGVINFVASNRGVIAGATSSLASVRCELGGVIYRLALFVDA